MKFFKWKSRSFSNFSFLSIFFYFLCFFVFVFFFAILVNLRNPSDLHVITIGFSLANQIRLIQVVILANSSSSSSYFSQSLSPLTPTPQNIKGMCLISVLRILSVTLLLFLGGMQLTWPIRRVTYFDRILDFLFKAKGGPYLLTHDFR